MPKALQYFDEQPWDVQRRLYAKALAQRDNEHEIAEQYKLAFEKAEARFPKLEEALEPFIAIYERHKDTPDADGYYEEIGFPTIRRLVEALRSE